MWKRKASQVTWISALFIAVYGVAFAQDTPPAVPVPRLSQIAYQMTAERWATTKTAQVTVNLDAALSKLGLNNINDQVQKNLHDLAPSGDWHITQFNRTQDSSGLEMLHIEAQARLAGTELSGIRDKAKSISKPGETYTIANIDFSPSQAEMEQALASARTDIYQQVNQEITHLNQLYPKQQYFVYSISFNGANPNPVALVAPRMMMATQEVNQSAGSVGAQTTQAVTAINVKVTQTATVVIGARLPKSTSDDEASSAKK